MSNDWRQVNNTEVGDHCDMDIIKGWYRMLINGKPASLPSVCIKVGQHAHKQLLDSC